MKIASWNVNSLKVRLPQLLDAAGYPASTPYRAKPTGEAAQ